ncbi:MAG: DUF3791 domain-containing protein [Lachnospiraceae bacterium]|nr:DUF3791 domain-containing protein [Lachnospiraceae bacterium]
MSLLKENYEIEHTLSFADAVDDLILICRKTEKDGSICVTASSFRSRFQ